MGAALEAARSRTASVVSWCLLAVVGCSHSPDFSRPTFELRRSSSKSDPPTLEVTEPEPGLRFESLEQLVATRRLAFAVAPFRTVGQGRVGELVAVALARQLAVMPYATTWHGPVPQIVPASGDPSGNEPNWAATVFAPPSLAPTKTRVGATGTVKLEFEQRVTADGTDTAARIELVVRFFGFGSDHKERWIADRRLSLTTMLTSEQVPEAEKRDRMLTYVLVRGAVGRLLRDSELQAAFTRFALVER